MLVVLVCGCELGRSGLGALEVPGCRWGRAGSGGFQG